MVIASKSCNYHYYHQVMTVVMLVIRMSFEHVHKSVVTLLANRNKLYIHFIHPSLRCIYSVHRITAWSKTVSFRDQQMKHSWETLSQHKQDRQKIGNNIILNFYKFFAETICIVFISECSEVQCSEVKWSEVKWKSVVKCVYYNWCTVM